MAHRDSSIPYLRRVSEMVGRAGLPQTAVRTERRRLPLTFDGSGAPQASVIRRQAGGAADQQVLHVLVLLLLLGFCLCCHGNGGGGVRIRHSRRKLLHLKDRKCPSERSVHSSFPPSVVGVPAGGRGTSVIIFPRVLRRSRTVVRFRLRVSTRSRLVRYSRANSLMMRQKAVTLMSLTEEDG